MGSHLGLWSASLIAVASATEWLLRLRTIRAQSITSFDHNASEPARAASNWHHPFRDLAKAVDTTIKGNTNRLARGARPPDPIHRVHSENLDGKSIYCVWANSNLGRYLAGHCRRTHRQIISNKSEGNRNNEREESRTASSGGNSADPGNHACISNRHRRQIRPVFR